MKKSREYRATYTNIRHDPDFLPMSKDAKAYWWMLKAELHVSGIGTVMLHTVAGLASMSIEEAKAAETELALRGWVQRDGAVVWIVNGLLHTPNLRPKDRKHRLYIADHIKTLPRCTLTDAFRARYSEWLEEAPPAGPSEGATEGPSEGVSAESTDKKEEVRSKTKAKSKASPRTAAVGSRSTWMSPFCTAWRQRYGGDMPAAASSKPLRALLDDNPDQPEVLRRWGIYLDATDGRFASAHRFASTYGEWENPPPNMNGSRPGIANRVFAKGMDALRDEP